MRIYISGMLECNVGDLTEYNAVYIPSDKFISSLKNDTGNDFFIWAYNSPWRNEGGIDLKELAKWNSEQISVLTLIKKTRNKVVLFNESIYSLSDILNEIAGQSCIKEREVPNDKQCLSDLLYIKLLSTWGKKYLNTLDRLEESSLNKRIKTAKNKKEKGLSSDEQLDLWLKYISAYNRSENRINELTESLSKRYDELAKLTILQEEKEKLYKHGVKIFNDENNKSDFKSRLTNNEADYDSIRVVTLENELKDKIKYIELLTKEVSLQKETILQLNKKTDEFTREINECKDSLGKRFNELAVVTGMLESSKKEGVKLTEKLGSQNKKNVSNKGNISWKMKSPLKGIRNTIGSKKKKSLQIKKSIEMIKQSGLFDEEWYLEQNLDVKSANIDPVRHYFLFGGFENRDPSSLFSSQGYLDLYKDVRDSGLNPLEHYIRYGKNEHRIVKSK